VNDVLYEPEEEHERYVRIKAPGVYTIRAEIKDSNNYKWREEYGYSERTFTFVKGTSDTITGLDKDENGDIILQSVKYTPGYSMSADKTFYATVDYEGEERIVSLKENADYTLWWENPAVYNAGTYDGIFKSKYPMSSVDYTGEERYENVKYVVWPFDLEYPKFNHSANDGYWNFTLYVNPVFDGENKVIDSGITEQVVYDKPITPKVELIWCGEYLWESDATEYKWKYYYKRHVQLVEGLDYTITYVNNDKPGWAHTIIKGIGNYCGEMEVPFYIRSQNTGDKEYSNSTTDGNTDEQDNKKADNNTVTDNNNKVKEDNYSNDNETNSNEPGEDIALKPDIGYESKGVNATFTVLSNDNMTVSYKNTSKKKNVKIPETVVINGYTYTVTEIVNNAFKNNKKLKTVIVPKTVTKIGKNAFFGAKKLKTITIKSNKVSIGKNAFKGINKKATFKVPKKSYKKMVKLIKKKKYGWKKTMKIKKG